MGVVNNNAYGGANLNNRRADDENARVAVKSDYVKLEEGTSATVEDVNGEFKITYGTVDGYKLTRVFQLSTMADRISTETK